MPSRDDILSAKILVVDDNPDNIELMADLLADAGYTCVTSTTRPEQVGALHRQHHYDLILLDLQMPGLNGFEVMKGLKQIERDGYLPVLAVTAQPSFKVAALAAGARDFISKPFDLAEMHKRIHNMLEVRLLYKELAEHGKRQRELALHDPLTGLPNRRLLDDRIGAALRQAERNQRKVAVMYLDLDGFKGVNDCYGHAYGDAILKMVGQRLLACIRREDSLARVGGDEFVAVLGALKHGHEARAPAEKMVAALSAPYFINDLTLTLSASVGVAIHPDDADGVDALLAAADHALYAAKRAGKNRSCYSSPADAPRAALDSFNARPERAPGSRQR